MIQWSQGDANPVVNTVTTCGMPPGGGPPPGGPSPVCDTDQHSTTIVPPGYATRPPLAGHAGHGSGTAPSSQPPQIAVSPARVRPGSARLRGPSGCPTTSAVAATVTGRRIVQVTFYVDSKKVKTLTSQHERRALGAADERQAVRLRHPPRAARIQFARSSQTRSRTLRLSFNRCHPADVTPKFTG